MNTKTITTITSTRRLSLVGLLLLVGLVVACTSQYQRDAQQALNHDRALHGLPALVDSHPVDRIAQQWADHLAAGGTFEHGDWLGRFATISEPICGSGENIAGVMRSYWKGKSAKEVLPEAIPQMQSNLMNSPGHRANILSSYSKLIGTGVSFNPTTGWAYLVQDFAVTC